MITDLEDDVERACMGLKRSDAATPRSASIAPAKADSEMHERRRTSVNVKKDGHEDDRCRLTDNDGSKELPYT